MTTFIHKITEHNYDLVVEGLTSRFTFNVLSSLSQEDFHSMIEYMEQMKVSKHLPFYYFFPRFKTLPEIDVRLVRNVIEYQLVLNLGARVLSEMNNAEFDNLLYELKDLVSQFIGHKVYFPPIKDVFKNDK